MVDTKMADASARQADHDANVAKERAAVANQVAAVARVEEVKQEVVAKEKIARDEAVERAKEQEKI